MFGPLLSDLSDDLHELLANAHGPTPLFSLFWIRQTSMHCPTGLRASTTMRRWHALHLRNLYGILITPLSKSGRRDLNPRPPAPKAGALPS